MSKTPGFQHLSEDDQENVRRHLRFVETRILEGEDLAQTVVTFARQQKITQIFLTRQPETTFRSWFAEGLVQRIVNLAQAMHVTIVADRSVRRAR